MIEGCPYFSRLLGPYIDGELPLADVASIEAHVVTCERCREETLLIRAMRRSMRRSSEDAAPASLRSRIATECAQDTQRASRQEAVNQFRSRAGAVISFAAAASFAVVWGVSHRDASGAGGLRSASISMGGVDDVLGDLLDEHAQPLPPEATDPKEVRRLERYVGVPVQPSQMDHVGGRFVGGRVLPLHRNRAARLEYQMGSGEDARRVSVFIFDPRKVQISGGEFAVPPSGQTVDNREVRVAHTRGYTVAVTQRGGIGYAVASDSYHETDIVSVLGPAP